MFPSGLCRMKSMSAGEKAERGIFFGGGSTMTQLMTLVRTPKEDTSAGMNLLYIRMISFALFSYFMASSFGEREQLPGAFC